MFINRVVSLLTPLIFFLITRFVVVINRLVSLVRLLYITLISALVFTKTRIFISLRITKIREKECLYITLKYYRLISFSFSFSPSLLGSSNRNRLIKEAAFEDNDKIILEVNVRIILGDNGETS